MDTRTPSTTHLTAFEQRVDWLRLIRSDNVGPHVSFADQSFRSARNWRCSGCPTWRGAAGAARPGRICSEEDARTELTAGGKHGVSLCRTGRRVSAAARYA